MTQIPHLNKTAVVAAMIVSAVATACLIAWAIDEGTGAVRPHVPDNVKQYQLLEFSGDWCLTCKLQQRRLDSTAVARVLDANNVKRVKINIDEDVKTAEAWNVNEVPVLVLVEVTSQGVGRTIRRQLGGLSTEELIDFVDPTK